MSVLVSSTACGVTPLSEPGEDRLVAENPWRYASHTPQIRAAQCHILLLVFSVMLHQWESAKDVPIADILYRGKHMLFRNI